MKKYILLSFILCFLFAFSVVANAEESTEKKYCVGELIPGDEYFLMVGVDFKVGDILVHRTIDYSGTVTSSNAMMCLYLSEMSTSPTGYTINQHLVPQVNTYREYSDCGTYNTTRYNTSFDCIPCEYNDPYFTSYSGETKYFITNIPIFQNYNDALAYSAGELDIDEALNYNKVFENGSYVSPFEDLEINDSDIVLPVLSNITHEGFTVDNINSDDRFLLEIYMQSGLESPANYVDGTLDISDALFVNNFGLINENSEAYYHDSVVDLNMMYSVDNNTALLSSINSFYTTYPSCYDYTNGIDRVWKASELYNIWGLPFGKQAVFFNHNTKVSASELASVTPYDIPNAYTQYKVRFFYFDDVSGWHYGPWANYTYFSDGNVVKSGIFQNNNGDIIETPTENGTQDTSGNISYSNNAEYINLNNPNELFSYIRATFNNIDLSMGNFATLFASVFGFIPAEIQTMLWLGIAVMVIIGVIKVIKG